MYTTKGRQSDEYAVHRYAYMHMLISKQFAFLFISYVT